MKRRIFCFQFFVFNFFFFNLTGRWLWDRAIVRDERMLVFVSIKWNSWIYFATWFNKPSDFLFLCSINWTNPPTDFFFFFSWWIDWRRCNRARCLREFFLYCFLLFLLSFFSIFFIFFFSYFFYDIFFSSLSFFFFLCSFFHIFYDIFFSFLVIFFFLLFYWYVLFLIFFYDIFFIFFFIILHIFVLYIFFFLCNFLPPSLSFFSFFRIFSLLPFFVPSKLFLCCEITRFCFWFAAQQQQHKQGILRQQLQLRLRLHL